MNVLVYIHYFYKKKKGLQRVFSVGRVQTPTLYLICKRQEEIENFTSQPFFS
ncbi:DNA topoisomerase [Virgibacillus pantothenticus]|uniref:DNA topoisomerase n=1 Tax=Virgibacillus pantothenticus TaxID=1473 RepID=UPI003D16A2FB